MTKRMKICLAVMTMALVAVHSQAIILYQDSFNDGVVGTTLNTTLDISTDGAVWKGAPGGYTYTTNTAVKVNTIALRSVYVEFTPEAGNIYTYSADVRVDPRTSSNTVPFCIGFISTNNLAIANPAIMSWFNNANSPWIQIDPQAAPGYPSGRPRSMEGSTLVTSGDLLDVNNFNNYQIILDTTGANWIARYLINGAEFSSHTYTGGNPTIGAFRFGSSGTVNNSIIGEVDDVELAISVIPIDQSSLYQDAFDDGTVGNSLNTTLDISTNGAVWKGAPGAYEYTTNTAVKANTIALRTVYVEFTPESGKVYTYSADVRVDPRTSSNTVPFCIGFISTNNLVIANPAIMSWFNNANSPWIQIDPQAVPGYPSGRPRSMEGNTLVTSGDLLDVNNFNNYQIILDTTGANWVATYLVNGTEFSSHAYTGGNPTIGAFGFGTSGTTANSILGEMDFVDLSVSVAPVGYEGWASGWGVDIGAETNDYDGDGLSNIYEYGLEGDPTNDADQGTSPEFGTMDVGGTNWFGYIHPQLAVGEHSGLSYSLELNSDLVLGVWTNSGYTVLGTNVTGGMLNFVTNITSVVERKKFIRLIIK